MRQSKIVYIEIYSYAPITLKRIMVYKNKNKTNVEE